MTNDRPNANVEACKSDDQTSPSSSSSVAFVSSASSVVCVGCASPPPDVLGKFETSTAWPEVDAESLLVTAAESRSGSLAGRISVTKVSFLLPR